MFNRRPQAAAYAGSSPLLSPNERCCFTMWWTTVCVRACEDCHAVAAAIAWVYIENARCVIYIQWLALEQERSWAYLREHYEDFNEDASHIYT